MARLPGGLPAWRGRRLLRGTPPTGGPLGCTVDATRHAALHSLVIEAAKFADMHAPATVRLGGAAEIRCHDNTLTVGLPLAWGLPAEHLRIVVAHELALPRTKHPELVRSLLAARSGGGRLDEATETLQAAVEQVRDAAAISAGGGGLSGVDDAAAALLRAATVGVAFAAFTLAEGSHVTGGGDAGGGSWRVRDLHAGWRLRLERWGAPVVERITWLPERHPGLSAELRASDPPRPALARDAVALDELSAGEQRDLAAQVITGDGQWTTFAELPAEVYAEEVERQAREYVEGVRAVLGRDPDDRDELAGTLLRRPVDVERARRRNLGETPADDEAEAPPWMGVVLLSVLVEYTLLKKGWRREHPLVARRLTGPGGLLDLNELYQRPDELRRLLTE